MKKFALALCLVLLASMGMTSLATSPAPIQELESTDGALPVVPLLLEIADFEKVFMSGGTCAKIRPVANHSDCNYDLCESNGCGAPFYFDAVDCACYCGYAF